MQRWSQTGRACIGILAVACAATGCASTGEGSFPREFEVFVEGGELDTLTFEPDAGGELDLGADRNRVGARFAFGGEVARGYVQLFVEKWEFLLPGGLPGAEYENFGIGGGVTGSPKVGQAGGGITFLVPYRAGVSVVGGQKSNLVPGEPDTDLLYVDLHADVGFGFDWNGLRPSVGVATNIVGGVLSNPAGDADLSGGNTGIFADASYKHPEFPMYGHVRLLVGDYQAATFGVGVKF